MQSASYQYSLHVPHGVENSSKLMISIISFGILFIPILGFNHPSHEFDPVIKTVFIADVTSKSDVENLHFSMFRALTIEHETTSLKASTANDNKVYVDGHGDLKFYSAERMNVADSVGIVLSGGLLKDLNGSEKINLHEFPSSGEDPRILNVGSDIIVSFTVNSKDRRRMAVSRFDPFNTILLSLPGLNSVEKNWAPFSKNNKLLFLYNVDPLIVIQCNHIDSDCQIVYMDEGVTLPFDTSSVVLRGGSNLVPALKNEERYYIGGEHYL